MILRVILYSIEVGKLVKIVYDFDSKFMQPILHIFGNNISTRKEKDAEAP